MAVVSKTFSCRKEGFAYGFFLVAGVGGVSEDLLFTSIIRTSSLVSALIQSRLRCLHGAATRAAGCCAIGYRPARKVQGNMGEGRPRGMVCGFISQNSSPLGTHTRETSSGTRWKSIMPWYRLAPRYTFTCSIAIQSFANHARASSRVLKAGNSRREKLRKLSENTLGKFSAPTHADFLT
jgi:hypothetical protein